MRTKRIKHFHKKAPEIKRKKYRQSGGIIRMDNTSLYATLSTNTSNTFTGQIGEDGTIYKYDYSTQTNIPIGVDKKTWNAMVDEKDKYYKLGLDNGYIKTPEQIAEEERLERERKEQEAIQMRENMATMQSLITSLQEEIKGLKAPIKAEVKANGLYTNNGSN